jgi:aryl-alcohol dehydrogenase-like predicted oxidoreductase
MQDNYKDIYREEEREINKFCNESGVGLVPRDPLSTAHLAQPARDQTTVRAKNKVLTEHDIVIIDRIEEVARREDCTVSQATLAWAN